MHSQTSQSKPKTATEHVHDGKQALTTSVDALFAALRLEEELPPHIDLAIMHLQTAELYLSRLLEGLQ